MLTIENDPSTLPSQTGHTQIISRVIIPRSTDFRTISYGGFIGSVSDFRSYLKAQNIFLKAGIIAP